MEKRMTIRKISSASLALLILALPGAMATESNKPAELRDHDYYSRELRKLKESTRRIHEEVDGILAEFRRNMERYRKHTRGATAILVEKEEASTKLKGQGDSLNGAYEVKVSVLDEYVYGTLDFSQKQPDQVEISNFKLSYDPFPKLKPKNIEGFESFQGSFKEQYPPSGHSSPNKADYFEKYAEYQVSRFVTSALSSMELALNKFKSPTKTYVLPSVEWDSGDGLNQMFIKLDISDVLELYVEYPYTVEMLNDLKKIKDPNRRSRSAMYTKKFAVKKPLFRRGDGAEEEAVEGKKSENLKEQANLLKGEYHVKAWRSTGNVYGMLNFSQKQPDHVEVSHFKLPPNSFPPFPEVDGVSFHDFDPFIQSLEKKYKDHYPYSLEYGDYQISRFVGSVLANETLSLNVLPGKSPRYGRQVQWESGNKFNKMDIQLDIEPDGSYDLQVSYPYDFSSFSAPMSNAHATQKFFVRKQVWPVF